MAEEDPEEAEDLEEAEGLEVLVRLQQYFWIQPPLLVQEELELMVSRWWRSLLYCYCLWL
jgi:hypothetical protein